MRHEVRPHVIGLAEVIDDLVHNVIPRAPGTGRHETPHHTPEIAIGFPFNTIATATVRLFHAFDTTRSIVIFFIEVETIVLGTNVLVFTGVTDARAFGQGFVQVFTHFTLIMWIRYCSDRTVVRVMRLERRENIDLNLQVAGILVRL